MKNKQEPTAAQLAYEYALVDKKLAKAVSRWVQSASTESVSEDDKVGSAKREDMAKSESNDRPHRYALTFLILPIFLAIAVSIFIRKSTNYE